MNLLLLTAGLLVVAGAQGLLAITMWSLGYRDGRRDERVARRLGCATPALRAFERRPWSDPRPTDPIDTRPLLFDGPPPGSEAPPEGWEAAFEAWWHEGVPALAIAPGGGPYTRVARLAFSKGFLAARPAPGGGGDWVLVPREPGTCELDDSGWLLAFMVALHSRVADTRPITGWSDFGDEQRERIRAAYRAMIAAAPPPPGGADVAGLLAEAERMITLILPLAKGYAIKHRVGANAEYVETAERFRDRLAGARAWRDDRGAPPPGAADTPGVPPDHVPVPRTDLATSVLSLGPGEKFVMIGLADYAAAGRVFKWLQGQIQIARRKIVG